MSQVVVIGGGISGLSAAWQLSKVDGIDVQLFESADRFGGKLQTTSFAGNSVDTGADAFLARVPEAVQLCNELGISDQLVAPAKGTALLWSRGSLHPFPTTTVLGIPSDLDDIARSGIISTAGLERAQQEVELPTHIGRDSQDGSLGKLVSARFGDEIKDRLVDPLVGSINAGCIDDLGVASATPQIFDIAGRNASLTVSARAQIATRPASTANSPVFLAPAEGMQRLADALIDKLTERNVELHKQSRVDAISKRADKWVITTEHGDVTADAIVAAVPTYQAAALFQDVAPLAADLLSAINYASVALIRLAYNIDDIGISTDASGFVIPAIEHKLLTACSFASSKWSALTSDDTMILRVSAGRFGNDRALGLTDESLIAAAHTELTEMMQLKGKPTAADVVRWPNAFPQYQPGHNQRVSTVKADIQNLRTVAVAGAGYQGLGVPACIRSGFEAAEEIKTALSADTQ